MTRYGPSIEPITFPTPSICATFMPWTWVDGDSMNNNNEFKTELVTLILIKKMFLLFREVKEALLNGEPVVALESTIITHGMPYPANIEMARNEFIHRFRNTLSLVICEIHQMIRLKHMR